MNLVLMGRLIILRLLVVEVSSGAKASKVLHVCPVHGAILFSRVVGDYKFVLRFTHDGTLVCEIRFLIFGGYLVIYVCGWLVDGKLLSVSDSMK